MDEDKELKEIKQMLVALFNQRDELNSQLRTTNDLIAQFGRGYWKRLGFTVMPRSERLRDEIMRSQG
jgi:hypothetical protein